MTEPGSTGSILSKNLRTPALTIDLAKLHPDLRDRFPDDATTDEVRQPHGVYRDHERGESIIEQGSRLIHPLLDGLTRGETATDTQGNRILDANGNPTIIRTGLFRPVAEDENGKTLKDPDGYICFSDVENQQEGFSNTPSALNPRTFLASWHPSTQIEYIMKHNQGPNDNSFFYTSIGSGAEKITACLTVDLKSVYIAEAIQLGDVMGLSSADKINLTKLPAPIFNSEIKTKLGLVTREESQEADGIYTAIKAYMDTEMDPEGTATDKYHMNVERTELFKTQLQMLLNELDNNPLVNVAAVNDMREDITNRYEQAKAFSIGAIDGNEETTPAGGTTPPKYVRSQDHGASIKETFTKLINHERSILQQKQAIEKLKVDSERYDLPVFIAIYQTSLYRLMEVENAVSTEIADQINDLIGIYTRMQNIINQVSGQFETKSGDTDPDKFPIDGQNKNGQSDFPGALGTVDADVSPASNAYIVAMFEKENRAKHPIEILYEIDRPTFSNISDSDGKMPGQQKTAYDSQATQISGSINILNQKAQSVLNKVSTTETKSTRHFEMANTALTKMHELVLTIARNVI